MLVVGCCPRKYLTRGLGNSGMEGLGVLCDVESGPGRRLGLIAWKRGAARGPCGGVAAYLETWEPGGQRLWWCWLGSVGLVGRVMESVEQAWDFFWEWGCGRWENKHGFGYMMSFIGRTKLRAAGGCRSRCVWKSVHLGQNDVSIFQTRWKQQSWCTDERNYRARGISQCVWFDEGATNIDSSLSEYRNCISRDSQHVLPRDATSHSGQLYCVHSEMVNVILWFLRRSTPILRTASLCLYFARPSACTSICW